MPAVWYRPLTSRRTARPEDMCALDTVASVSRTHAHEGQQQQPHGRQLPSLAGLLSLVGHDSGVHRTPCSCSEAVRLHSGSAYSRWSSCSAGTRKRGCSGIAAALGALVADGNRSCICRHGRCRPCRIPLPPPMLLQCRGCCSLASWLHSRACCEFPTDALRPFGCVCIAAVQASTASIPVVAVTLEASTTTASTSTSSTCTRTNIDAQTGAFTETILEAMMLDAAATRAAAACQQYQQFLSGAASFYTLQQLHPSSR